MGTMRHGSVRFGVEVLDDRQMLTAASMVAGTPANKSGRHPTKAGFTPYRSLRTMLLLAIPVFTAMALLTPTGDVFGQAKKKQETATQSDDHLAKAIVTLHHVKATLEKANHDYGGFRAAAVRDVKVASDQLHLALETVHKAKKKPKDNSKDKKDGKAGKESQKLSDTQLAAAIPVLKNAHKTLMEANHNYGGHREKAVVDLGAAIVSLERALAFSKINNPR